MKSKKDIGCLVISSLEMTLKLVAFILLLCTASVKIESRTSYRHIKISGIGGIFGGNCKVIDYSVLGSRTCYAEDIFGNSLKTAWTSIIAFINLIIGLIYSVLVVVLLVSSFTDTKSNNKVEDNVEIKNDAEPKSIKETLITNIFDFCFYILTSVFIFIEPSVVKKINAFKEILIFELTSGWITAGVLNLFAGIFHIINCNLDN